MPFFIGAILPKSKIKNGGVILPHFYFSFLKFKIENPEGLVVGNVVGNRPTDLTGGAPLVIVHRNACAKYTPIVQVDRHHV